MEESEIKNWRLRAAEQQQTFYTLFSDRKWDKLDKNHHQFVDNLQVKISFALFARSYLSCDVEQQQRINSITEKVLELSGTVSDSIYIGYTYVSTYTNANDGIVPLLRIRNDNDRVYFVEFHHSEVYEGWNNFVENNLLDNCLICYPKNGIYRQTPEGRVSVEYGEICSDRIENRICTKPVEIWSFFPFAEASFFQDAKIVVKHSATFAKMNKSPTPRRFLDYDSLFVWFKMIAPEFGTLLKYDSTCIFLSMATDYAKKAIEIFKLFYDSPYSVRCSFAGVTLMKTLLTIRVGKPLNQCIAENFADSVKFVANLSLSRNQLDSIISAISDNDSYWNNIFKVSTNCDFQPFKEMRFCENDKDVSGALHIVSKPIPNDSLLADVIKELISEVYSLIDKKTTQVRELGSRASNIISCSLKFKLYQAYARDMKLMRTALREKLNGVAKINIKSYTLDVLKIMLDCVKKVTSSLVPNERTELLKIYEQQFFKFIFHFVDSVEKPVDLEDVFLFITDKFIIQHQAFFIEYQSTKTSINEPEGVFYTFIELLSDTSKVKELSNHYLAINQLCDQKLVSAPIIFYRGMCVKLEALGDTNVIRFGTICETTWTRCFGNDYTSRISKEDIYNDYHVLLSSLDGKYVMNFLTHNLRGFHGQNRAESIAFNITFSL